MPELGCMNNKPLCGLEKKAVLYLLCGAVHHIPAPAKEKVGMKTGIKLETGFLPPPTPSTLLANTEWFYSLS
jgi:hypothetical protein